MSKSKSAPLEWLYNLKNQPIFEKSAGFDQIT